MFRTLMFMVGIVALLSIVSCLTQYTSKGLVHLDTSNRQMENSVEDYYPDWCDVYVRCEMCGHFPAKQSAERNYQCKACGFWSGDKPE